MRAPSRLPVFLALLGYLFFHGWLVGYLLFYSRIFYLCGDVTINGEGLQNLGLLSRRS
jgi:hypothetical protein